MKLKTLLLLALLLSCEHDAPMGSDVETNLPQWPMAGRNLRNTSNAADPVEYYTGPETGTIIWKYDFGHGEQALTSPSIVADGTIYFATIGLDSGFVYAINPDGTRKWRFSTEKGWGAQASGAVGSDGMYFIGSVRGFLSPFLSFPVQPS